MNKIHDFVFYFLVYLTYVVFYTFSYLWTHEFRFFYFFRCSLLNSWMRNEFQIGEVYMFCPNWNSWFVSKFNWIEDRIIKWRRMKGTANLRMLITCFICSMDRKLTNKKNQYSHTYVWYVSIRNGEDYWKCLWQSNQIKSTKIQR